MTHGDRARRDACANVTRIRTLTRAMMHPAPTTITVAHSACVARDASSQRAVRDRARARRGARPASRTALASSSTQSHDGDADDDDGARARMSRRHALAATLSTTACAFTSLSTTTSLAHASGAVPVPDVAPASGALGALESQTVSIFARAAASAVNVVDLTVLSSSGNASANAGAIVAEGNGTGIVWDDEGRVVTNYHVIAGVLASIPPGRRANEVAKVTIQTDDGSRTFGASLVGASKEKDLVVLQINAPKELLKPVTLGTSEGAKVGQAVFAIVNPFGFDHTLTTGVISGLNRTIQTQSGSFVTGAIQCDAAINPGNSCGLLLDANGRLVGVNTAIFTPTGSSAGVGFAIPVDTVKSIVPQLIKNGQVILPSLNIAFGDAAIMRDLKIQLGSGALAHGFVGESNAAKAGVLSTRRCMGVITPGDVIIEIDGRKVSTEADVVDAIERKSVGDVVKIRVKRFASVGADVADMLYFDVQLAPSNAK